MSLTIRHAQAATDASTIPYDEIQTGIIRLANQVNPVTGAIETPFSNAVTYAARTEGKQLAQSFDGGQGYGVYRNPAWTALEKILSYIEGGSDAVAVSTGRAAIDLALRLLPVNSHIIVAPDGLYPGTRLLFDDLHETTGLEVTYADSNIAALEAARRPNTRMIFTEPLTNPLLKVANLKAVVDFAKKYKLLSIADNTLTPLLARPFDYGFDLIIQSATKYISGHNDKQAGAVIVNKDRPGLADKLRVWRNRTGATLSPLEASAIVQYAKDFPNRLKTHCDNALEIARWLEDQPEVATAHYPGLKTNSDYALASKQFGAFGGIISFELRGGEPEARRFLAADKNILLADSFGADCSLLNYYSLQSAFFRAQTEEQRAQHGITPTFLRLAVGRESVRAIKEDLQKGFDAINEGFRNGAACPVHFLANNAATEHLVPVQ